MQRPDSTEYAEYYGLYVNQVPEGEIFEILKQGVALTVETLEGVSEDQETYRYQDDRWSIREVIGHMVDTERLFSYRALSMARADPAELPGMDQDQWAVASNANERPLASLLEEFAHVRASSVALFESFTGDIWDRRGQASGCEFTVRAFPYILAGHEIHHRRVLEEKYLANLR